MKLWLVYILFCVLPFGWAACVYSNCDPSASTDGLTVRTLTGTFTGLLNPQYSQVREFRNVPYAQPPVGSLRWLPPQQLPWSTRHSYSINYPPSCPQYVSRIPSVWNQVVPEYIIYNGNENTTAGRMAQTTAEDCLSLAVWTPVNATSSSNLPVLMFMTGGGFQTGGIQIPYQIPASWVERTQAHIVVTINYRVNIMGFPNAAGLDDQNLGILDQRMALEWVQSNIAAFGGDATAITLWGQSAGSYSTDFQNYAFYQNPIARAFFMQSGTAMARSTSEDYSQTNFTFVAKNLGCDFPCDSAAELDCMRNVPITLMENYLGQYQDNSTLVNATQPPLGFRPISDEKIIFSNYIARTQAGLISRLPAIISNTANEMSSLYTYPVNNVTAGPYQPAVDAATLNRWICVSANTSTARHAAGLTTYRYHLKNTSLHKTTYAGNFSNVSPLGWMGAYHASDLLMNFGTYGVARGSGTEFERQVSETMQDYLFSYISDPINGLANKGWLPYDPTASDGGMIMRFGADDITAQRIGGLDVDGPCHGVGTYDSSP